MIASTNVLNEAVARLDLNDFWGQKFNQGAPFKTWESQNHLAGTFQRSPHRRYVHDSHHNVL